MRRARRTEDRAIDEADPRFVPVAEALVGTPGFSLMESSSGATRGLMLNGKSFGMSSHRRFILKLGPERATALIDAGLAIPFSPSAGKILRGWIEVTDPTADWVSLAREALRMASTVKHVRRAQIDGR